MNYREELYKGYAICINFYGRNEITVQYCGDDIIFNSIDDAKSFIDGIVRGDIW